MLIGKLRLCKRLWITMFCLSTIACGTGDNENNSASDALGNDEQQVDSRVAGVDFHEDVAPILKTKCLACHGCYDAPCQLKMESLEGLLRGATQQQVYNAGRTENAAPTRLHIDASGEAAWREKGFHSVLKGAQGDEPLMKSMIALGRENGFAQGSKLTKDNIKLGGDRELSCTKPGEFAKYKKANPHGGMPLAVQGLTQAEFETLNTWLDEGAQVAAANESETVGKKDLAMVEKWESWLNEESLEQALLSRYLYEHLFLGHLYLNSSDATPQFFKIVRSSTAPGKALAVIASTLPNGPTDKKIFYRLQAVKGNIVYKTHIPYRFDNERLRWYKKLFFKSDWQVNQLPGYGYKERANPFVTFAAIPAKARYEFLLNEAEYFVKNFIRGPVCHGPIATDVIRDQFWTMFESPKTDHYVNSAEFRKKATPLLGLPGEKDKLFDLGPQWLKYSDKRNDYVKMRIDFERKHHGQGASLDNIWDGDGKNDNAFLSVFRHHDSASVLKGWKGDFPRTAWVLDYPLFERTYYELVVGFNVFGSVSHQLQTRLYFDLIRNGGESNFLRLLPAAKRQALYDEWYEGSGQIKVVASYHPIDTKIPSQIPFATDDSKREVFEKIIAHFPQLKGKYDFFNRCDQSCTAAIANGKTEQAKDSALVAIANVPAAEFKSVAFLPDLTLLKVHSSDTPRIYSLIRNRMHTNVAFMLGESLRYEEGLDHLTVLPTVSGSYPNLMLSVDEDQVSELVRHLLKIESEAQFEKFIDRYAVRRMSEKFWQELHGFSDVLEQRNPLEVGVLDISRYGYY